MLLEYKVVLCLGDMRPPPNWEYRSALVQHKALLLPRVGAKLFCDPILLWETPGDFFMQKKPALDVWKTAQIYLTVSANVKRLNIALWLKNGQMKCWKK
jgi:hypothetical protein